MTQSDHFDGRRFFNPEGPELEPFTAVPKMLTARRTRWPRWVVDPAQPIPRLSDATAAVTFIGHATFLIQTSVGNVLTDPVFSQRAGPSGLIGPRRVRQPAISMDALPPVSMILLSHNHYDHCDVRSLRTLAKRFGPVTVTPIGNASLLRSAGLRNIVELDWWQDTTHVPLPVTLTPAHHFSARGPFDRNRALWGGFLIRIGTRRIYFAGDTAYGSFFAQIRERLGPIDLALLPIGAYEPRWFMKSVHMNPEEAVRAHQQLETRRSIGMHFGTFQLTTEGIDEPVRALQAALAMQAIDPTAFRALAFGETAYVEA